MEIAPLLAFYDVDSRRIQILGTEKFNIGDIKNEPSLEKAWIPMISNNNTEDLKLIWNDAWNDEFPLLEHLYVVQVHYMRKEDWGA